MDKIKKQELKQMWQDLRWLSDDVDFDEAQQTLANSKKYSEELYLMIQLRYIMQLKNRYKNILEYANLNSENIPELLERVNGRLFRSNLALRLKLQDYANLFTEEITKMKREEMQTTEVTKVYKPFNEDDEER